MKLFDLHCDTLCKAYLHGGGILSEQNDFSFLSSGDTQCQIFAIWIDDVYSGNAAKSRFYALYRNSKKLFSDYQLKTEICKSGADISAVLAKGKCAALLSLENASAFAGQLSNIIIFHELGIRFVTLTWNGENELGYGCLSEDKGLKDFGKAAVKLMDKLSVTVDVSHLSSAGFWDVCEISEKPFIASHSCSYDVFPHPRNLTDAQFLEIKRRKGIVGLNLYPKFVNGKEDAGYDDIYRHIDHFLSLDGEDILAIGSDIDGAAMPKCIGGTAGLPGLFDYLQSKNISKRILNRIFFQNAHDYCVTALTNESISDKINSMYD